MVLEVSTPVVTSSGVMTPFVVSLATVMLGTSPIFAEKVTINLPDKSSETEQGQGKIALRAFCKSRASAPGVDQLPGSLTQEPVVPNPDIDKA